MFNGNIEQTQEKCDCVTGIIKESIQRLNLKNAQPGDIIDYKTSFGLKDWTTLKNSKCFHVEKDENGERLVMKQECKDCQETLASSK
jgi:hypothetical protein